MFSAGDCSRRTRLPGWPGRGAPGRVRGLTGAETHTGGEQPEACVAHDTGKVVAFGEVGEGSVVLLQDAVFQGCGLSLANRGGLQFPGVCLK